MGISRRRFLALSSTFAFAACAPDGDASDTSGGATSDTTGAATPTTDSPTADAPDSTIADTTTTTTTSTTVDTVPAVQLDDDPFVFGVASGDPEPGSVVIWTRLAGDLPAEGIEVAWEFAGDDDSTIRSGVATTAPELGGSVHVIVDTDTPGVFIFSAGGWTSQRGRTAPVDPTVTSLRLAVASCQHFETGHYAAHRDIAEWQPDLVLFLGDFIYEGAPLDPTADGVVRSHEGPEPETLDGYRARYATYLGDPHLQSSRGIAPWIVVWDDHEVENNYAALVSENDDDPAAFGARRTAAYRAWWENMPTRLPAPDLDRDPTQPYPIHRGVDIGSLVRISMLDGRQFRDDQLSNEILDTGPPVPGWDDPARTMLGPEQEAWIAERFTTSPTTWNCLAQQTILSDTRLSQNGAILNYDQWDGYHPARQRLLADAPENLVTLTGDIHLAGIGVLGSPDAPVGVEFVTTAISSVANVAPTLRDVVLSIPAIVDAELVLRGYTRHTVTPEAWTAEYRQVVDIFDADSPAQTWKRFQVASGSPAVTEL